jgi:hypothetical protein
MGSVLVNLGVLRWGELVGTTVVIGGQKPSIEHVFEFASACCMCRNNSLYPLDLWRRHRKSADQFISLS